MNFNNKDHEELFYMFISEFMNWSCNEYFIYLFTQEGTLAHRLLDLFPCEDHSDFQDMILRSVRENKLKLKPLEEHERE